jgi:hypothetical protein
MYRKHVKQQPEDDSFIESKHVVELNEQQKVTFTRLNKNISYYYTLFKRDALNLCGM